MNCINKFKCEKIENLLEIASKLIGLHPDKRIFAFYGDMGVGKTTFIKIICKVLGVKDLVSSPSFGIIHKYVIPDGNDIFHFDFYRIKNIEEVFDIGYEDYFYSGSYCFVEWADKVNVLLPDDCVKIRLEEENGVRFISF